MNLLVCILDCLRKDYFDQSMPKTRAALQDTGFSHFQNHWGVAHCSDPNFSTLLTGVSPQVTGIHSQMGAGFKTPLPTLAYHWKKNTPDGFTWSIQPAKVPAFYRTGMDVVNWHKDADSADLELTAVRAMMSEAAGRPWFGFIRDMTAHYPYFGETMPTRGEGGEIRPLYEKAIQHLDTFIPRLVGEVLDKNPNTIVVIGADHGELLGEHGLYDHLFTLHSILTHVPFAIRIPGLAGRITTLPTQHTDLYPTLANLFGGWPARNVEGVNLLPWLRGDEKHPTALARPLKFQGTGAGMSEKRLDTGKNRVLWRHRAVVQGEWKYTENFEGGHVVSALTRADDYYETGIFPGRRAEIKRLQAILPPLPDYQSWETEAIRQMQDAPILTRLQALGYA